MNREVGAYSELSHDNHSDAYSFDEVGCVVAPVLGEPLGPDDRNALVTNGSLQGLIIRLRLGVRKVVALANNQSVSDLIRVPLALRVGRLVFALSDDVELLHKNRTAREKVCIGVAFGKAVHDILLESEHLGSLLLGAGLQICSFEPGGG
ncbi:hypothetical protein QAD02_000879 [Eretmocerus hayati]|uniref:Uncharacterized protein n=1 Tax=Eretmocerus hayati TaxID=131215 RepID=A0ACC2NEN0_9HYME|nr:hypothetical protein QAD02_000879 [Eretmocerus hayati]